jgi:hypothetical protein
VVSKALYMPAAAVNNDSGPRISVAIDYVPDKRQVYVPKDTTFVPSSWRKLSARDDGVVIPPQKNQTNESEQFNQDEQGEWISLHAFCRVRQEVLRAEASVFGQESIVVLNHEHQIPEREAESAQEYKAKGGACWRAQDGRG